MKGGKREMEFILIVFLEKDLIQGSFFILAHKWFVPLTLIQVGFLEVSFERSASGGVKLPPSPKLVRIMLQTSISTSKQAHICSFRKYTFQYQGPPNFADVSILLQKIVLFGKNSTFTQSNSVRFVLEIFQFCFQFL